MKKNTIYIYNVLFILFLLYGNTKMLAQVGSPLPVNLTESDYFNDTSLTIPSDRRVNFIDEGGIPNDGIDDSQALKNLINRLIPSGSGLSAVITIPAGEWIISDIFMRNNLHLVFDKDAVVFPILGTNNGGNTSIFKFGAKFGLSENISIRTLGGKFTIDMSNLPPLSRITVFNVKWAENFMVSNCHVIDKKTIHAILNCSVVKNLQGEWKRSRNGLVKNISQENAHGGYGVVQVRSGEKMLFKDLSSVGGGVTLRLESDDVTASGAPQDVSNFSEISGYNIKAERGNSAVMIQPWGAKNGWLDVQKIEAIGCKSAVRIDRAFVDLNAPSIGTFDPRSRVTDVKCTFGTNAQVNRGSFDWVPCGLRDPSILRPNPIPNMENKFHLGPTIAPFYYRASSNTGNDPRYYSINIPSLQEIRANSFGFPNNSKMIVRNEDGTRTCTLSVDDVEAYNSVKFYPNPVTDELNFSVQSTSENLELKVYNIMGKLISEKTINVNQSNLDVKTFTQSRKSLQLNQSGVYIVQIKNASGSINNIQRVIVL